MDKPVTTVTTATEEDGTLYVQVVPMPGQPCPS